ncbi:hypothetical protein BV898_11026 [Hypsibius exemplaris]|uniref:Transcription initiation factor TFIID subunit 8 n=1 Tax=Hypsibius exemplaris TaxID=2072580 RepID=A0A1W0WHV6_HYPEX|nr:hypothetical protein BV898_11026 [Hypsibius exemplaris]
MVVAAEDGSSSAAIGGSSTEAAISSCVRSVVAAILIEHGVEDMDDPTCLTILEQILTKNIVKNASLTQSFAEHAMRAQAHFSDVIMAVAFSGVDIPRMKAYFTKEYKYPKILDGAKLTADVAPTPQTPMIFQSGEQRKLPKYIPDHFPPMPSVYTFESTAVQKQNKAEYKQVREKMSLERRQVEKSLAAYHLRVVDRYDSPFNLNDPVYSLLPATYGLTAPAWMSACIPSKHENRRTDEAKPWSSSSLAKEDGGEKRREEDEMLSIRDAPSEQPQPRKYKRHGLSKKHGGGVVEKKQKAVKGKQGGGKKTRHNESSTMDVDDQSNSTSFSAGIFSPS